MSPQNQNKHNHQKQNFRNHQNKSSDQEKNLNHELHHNNNYQNHKQDTYINKEANTDSQKESKDSVKKEQEQKPYPYIAFVSFKGSKKVYTFGTDSTEYKVGDQVIVETIRGLEVGTIMRDCEVYINHHNNLELKPILRKARQKDIDDVAKNAEAAKEALVICDKHIKELNLDMNLIEAEYTLDRSKIIFVYVADERVDFRELLKALAAEFKCRIELRQIGPRNKSKIIGGLGMCGMETCCSRFLNDFDVVSINMAKNQLSGQCGKLMCCLKYEDQQYKKLREGLPKLNSQIEYKGHRYRVTSLNVLLQQAKIENKEDVQFLSFQELWPDIDFSDR